MILFISKLIAYLDLLDQQKNITISGMDEMQSIMTVRHIKSKTLDSRKTIFTCTYLSSLGNKIGNHVVTLYPSNEPLRTCHNESMGGYSWPETVIGEVAYKPCKESATGELLYS